MVCWLRAKREATASSPKRLQRPKPILRAPQRIDSWRRSPGYAVYPAFAEFAPVHHFFLSSALLAPSLLFDELQEGHRERLGFV